VDEGVQPFETGKRLREPVEIGQVHYDAFALQRRQFLGATPQREHAVPGGRERRHDGLADPARRSGDDGRLLHGGDPTRAKMPAR
jgi:hypothetical protein